MAQNARRCPELPATLPGQSVLNGLRDAQGKGPQQLLKGQKFSKTTLPWCKERLETSEQPYLPIVLCSPLPYFRGNFESNAKMKARCR